jgi:hypothetical protein
MKCWNVDLFQPSNKNSKANSIYQNPSETDDRSADQEISSCYATCRLITSSQLRATVQSQK